jgi:CW-type Zinc Finger
MSSLRLALKQSLQEAGGLSGDDDAGGKKKRKKSRKSMIREQRRNSGDVDDGKSTSKKRGPGRPRKYPRPDDMESGETPPKKRGPGRPRKSRPSDDHDDEAPDSGDEGSRRRHDGPDDEGDDGHSSSENEFSSSSGEEEEDDDGSGDGSDDDKVHDNDEEEGEDDEDEEESGDEDGSDEDDEKPSNLPKPPSFDMQNQKSFDNHDEQSLSVHGGEDKEPARRPRSRDTDTTEEELRRKRKLLKKKLKHSAANKIQNQWKKKKVSAAEREEGASMSQDDDTADAAPKKKSSSPPHGKKSEPSKGRDGEGPVKKKAQKKKNNGVVPRPSHEVMEWAHNMSEKKCRKHIASGMRVKVRFAVPVKRDGQTVKKKIWYGGRVTAVSKMGSKIRIKYDDGTSEVSQFPDADIVVDNEDNGLHSVSADRFIPPSLRQPKEDHHASFTTVESSAADSVMAMEVEAISAPSHHREEDNDEQKPTPPKSTTAIPDKATAVSTKQIEEKEIEVPESTKTQPSEPATPESRPSHDDTSGHRRKESKTIQKSVGSPEEGELSPGMTIKKDEPQESPSTIPVQLDVANDSETKKDDVVTAAESEQPKLAMSSQNDFPTSMEEDKNKDSSGRPFELRVEPKLVVHIPSESLKKAPSPKPSPPEEKGRETSVTDVLMDTPVNADDHKRKRSEEGENETEEPPKRKIKVSIPKLPHATSEKLKFDNESGNKDNKRDNHRHVVTETKETTLESDQTPVNRVEDNTRKDISKPTEKRSDVESTKSPSEDPKQMFMREHISQESKSQFVGETKEVAGTQSIEEHPAVEKNVKKDEGPKTERSKSPLPKRSISPIPPLKKDDMLSETASSEALRNKTAEGSEGADPKESGRSAPDDQRKNPVSLATSRSNESINSIAARGGRKAAMEAMEKMTTSKEKKEKDPSAEQGLKKKKRKRKDETEGADETQDWVNEMEWVQCDSCSKWRVLPSNVKVSDLPNKWYCHLNVYDPKRISCDAPEQTAKQALKELKRAKKRAKRLEQLEAEKAEKAANQEEVKKESGKKDPAVAVPSHAVSPKPPTKLVIKMTAKPKEGVVVKAEDQSESGSEENKSEKKRRGKKGKVIQQQQHKEQQQQQQQSPQQEPDTTESQAESTAPVGDPPKKKKRGRPPRNTTSSSSQDNRDADNVEWVQCEKCSKWRKLPADLSADELPDVWVCSMNSWNPAVASCKASEETTDAQHQEVGNSEWQLRQTHAGKYSYRTMIFGTGAKKLNRPMSERSRAAESLFQSPDDDERPYPTCMYSKSSMFLPRTSNFHKSQMAEEKTASVFDVLSDSNMFNELRDANLVVSGGGQKVDTYEGLDKAKRNAMSDLVLEIIGDDAFTGDQIIAVAKVARIGEMSRYCTTDIIINTLLALVKDGVLEMSCVNPAIPIEEWIPQFRRTRTRRARQIIDNIKSSSCLKISKPWKKKPIQQTEWVTGVSLQS